MDELWGVCRRRPVWTNIGLFLLLYCLWLLTSADQFRKYFHARAFLLCIAGALCIGLALACTTWLANRSARPISWSWLVLLWVVWAIAYWAIYPMTLRHLFGPGSDGENALFIAATELVHGHFPYYRHTYLNNPITPMPGALLLALPFLLLGRVSFQALFWIAIFVLISDKFFSRRITALTFLVVTIFASAGILDELFVGDDYTLNAIYLAVAIWCVVRAHRSSSVWLQVLAALFLGLALSSRVIYFVIPPLIFAYLLHNHSLRTAVRTVTIVLAAAAVVTVPFYLYDPAHFSPLHVSEKLGFLSPPAQHALTIFLPAAALIIACAGFFRRLNLRGVYLLAGISTAVIIIPPAVLWLPLAHFSPDSWQLLAYASAPAIFMNLWAFHRFEELNLRPVEASSATAHAS